MSRKTRLYIHGHRAKKKFFFWKKKSKWQTEFFNVAKSWAISAKISWIGPRVNRIDWCKGHWCGSIYIAARLSDISTIIGKKCILCVFSPFLSLCRRTSWPYRLSHINALRINQSYKSKDQSIKFRRKSLSFWRCWKIQFFLSRPFWIWILFFASSPRK